MAEKNKKTIYYSALLLCVAAVVLRCFQFFKQTNLQSGRLNSTGSVLSVIIFALIIGFAILSFMLTASEGQSLFSDNKSSTARLFMVLSGMALFYDFVRQCLNDYAYFTKTTYIKWNYVIPLSLFGLFALASSMYFFALAFLSSGKGYDLKRVHLLHYLPLFWAVCGLLTNMSVLEDLRDVQQAIYKSAALAFAMLFFAVYAAAFSQPSLYKRLFIGFGLSYAFIAAVYSVPELLGLALGAYSLNSVYFAGTFLLTGAFAFAASGELLFERK